MSLSLDIRLKKGAFALDVQAELSSQKVTAIIGASGAGKSSLLRCIAGLEPGAEGTIFFEGEDWMRSGKALPSYQRQIGFVFQHAALFDHLSVYRNLEYAAKRAQSADSVSKLPSLMKTLGIESLRDRSPTTLSGGERQRVALARAIASQPKILLLDEPLSSVDPDARTALCRELEHVFFTFDIPALYVSHHLEEAARLSDFTLRLQNGRVAAHGATSEILYPATADQPVAILSIHGSRPEDHGLVSVQTSAGSLLLPADQLQDALPKRLLVRAAEVGLSRQELPQSSFLNQLPATVETLRPIGESRALATLKCGQSHLYSLLTQRSIETLALSPGSSVYALIKSVSLQPGPL